MIVTLPLPLTNFSSDLDESQNRSLRQVSAATPLETTVYSVEEILASFLLIRTQIFAASKDSHGIRSFNGHTYFTLDRMFRKSIWLSNIN